MRPLRLLPLLVAGAFMASAPPSSATTEVEYHVDLEAYVYFDFERFEDRGNHDTSKFSVSTWSRLRAEIDNVTFRDGRMINTDAPWGLAELIGDGDGNGIETRWNADKQRVETTNGTCTAEPGGVPPGRALIRQDPTDTEPTGGQALQVHFADLVFLSVDCDKTPDAMFNLAGGKHAFPLGVFDTGFILPPDAIGMGKIIQKVDAYPFNHSPDYCPGVDYRTQLCSFYWKGTVTFTKTNEWHSDDTAPAAAPLTQPGPPGAPVAPVGPVTPAPQPALTSAAPSVPQRATLGRAGDRLSFVAACPTGCTGTAVLNTTRARAASALGRLRFSVAPGAPRKVTLKLPAAARRAIRSRRPLRVAVTLRPDGGGATARTTLTVRAGR